MTAHPDGVLRRPAPAVGGAGYPRASILALGFLAASLAAAAFVGSEYVLGGVRAALLLVAAAAIQLRLCCDVSTKTAVAGSGVRAAAGIGVGEYGARIEDVLILFAAGCAAPSPWGFVLGGAAALLAVVTAHLRTFGGGLGFAEDFCGPFSRMQRMFFLMVAAVIAAAEAMWLPSRWSLLVALALVLVGTALTAARRLLRLTVAMQGR